jgi:hypothetical protein
MKPSAIIRSLIYFQILDGLVLVLLVATVCSAGDAQKPAVSETAQRLVDEAQHAKLVGDASRQFALLRQAISIAPDFELARWQLGQLKIDDEWLTVEEAQRRAGANPKQAEYRELRALHGENAEGQLALARWCRKNDLNDEAKFHWASLLSVNPANEEALEALDMQWSGGRLLTRDQIADQRDQLRQYKKIVKEWRPKIARWERNIWGTNALKREAALKEIRAIAEPTVIPALEQLSLGEKTANQKRAKESTELSFAILDALSAIRAPVATQSLVRHAVFSPIGEVRASATEKLKPRPQHEYVPLLLGGLAMPIESSFQVRTDAGGSVHYTHSLYREGADSDWAFDLRHSAVQHQLDSRSYTIDIHTNRVKVGPTTESPLIVAARKGVIAERSQVRFGNAASAAEMQLAQLNEATERFNSSIISVLTGATEMTLGDSTKAWWDWWRDQNEYYASDERPVERHYDSKDENYYHGRPSYRFINTGPPPPPPPPGRYSCFAKGTPVWTKTGQRAIENLELGDLVLSQDVESGELRFKPIIARTVRPPSEIIKLSIADEELRTTLGHPFWVAGVGWRMAKELEDGAILHGVTGAPRVTAIEKAEKEEAYNLVVADFNTYFVGDSGVLVHDNTPRTPTRATLPGLAAK